MSILITHGYLLTGTGSNLYVNNLVRELVKKGESVLLVCQDFDPMNIDFINELYDFNSDNSAYERSFKKETIFAGNCKCFRPNLNAFLPVYVYDHYEGFEVDTFNSCSNEQVNAYVQQNFRAMDLILKDHEVSVINTNHLVMFPYIAKLLKQKHEFKFVITVHGSALNFTVKKDKRFEQFAVEALKSVDEIVVDSLHADTEMKEFLESVQMVTTIKKMQIIPAGVDIGSFGVAQKSKNELKQDFIASVSGQVRKSKGRNKLTCNKILRSDLSKANLPHLVSQVRAAYDYRDIDQDLVVKMDNLDLKNHNLFFVGKYLWTKGIYLILFSLPEILEREPQTNLILSGFGPFREPAELILNYLANGDLQGLIQELKSNEVFADDDGQVIPLAESILAKHGERITKVVSSLNFDLREKVIFTGILNHEQLVHLLPMMDVLIAPSVFPEAFGMVAVEAAACGVYPIVTYQSAFKEIADQIKAIAKGKIQVTNVILDSDASFRIAQNTLFYLSAVRSMKEGELTEFKRSLRALVEEQYSWEGIATKYMQVFAD